MCQVHSHYFFLLDLLLFQFLVGIGIDGLMHQLVAKDVLVAETEFFSKVGSSIEH